MDVRDRIKKYFREEGFVDRRVRDIRTDILKHLGKDEYDKLDKRILNAEENGSTKDFFDLLCIKVAGIPIYDRFMARGVNAQIDILDHMASNNYLTQSDCILDIGCGTGIQSAFFADFVSPRGFVTGVDLSGKMIDIASARSNRRNQTNVSYMVGDFNDIDFSVGRYSLIFAFSSLTVDLKDHGLHGDDFSQREVSRRLSRLRNFLQQKGKVVWAFEESGDIDRSEYYGEMRAGATEHAGFCNVDYNFFPTNNIDQDGRGYIAIFGEKED